MGLRLYTTGPVDEDSAMTDPKLRPIDQAEGAIARVKELAEVGFVSGRAALAMAETLEHLVAAVREIDARPIPQPIQERIVPAEPLPAGLRELVPETENEPKPNYADLELMRTTGEGT